MLGKIGDWIAAGQKENLKVAGGAAITVFAGAGASAFVSGGWQKVLLAIGGIAAVVLLGSLVNAGMKHNLELGEVRFDQAKDEEAERREPDEHERSHRFRIAEATETSDPSTYRAEVDSLLERNRKFISGARSAPLYLLLLDDARPHAPVVISKSGVFDHAVLDDPRRLFNWLQEQGAMVYSAVIPGLGGELRLVGVAEKALGRNDKAEIERAASHAQTLLLAQSVAGSERRLAG